MIIVFINQQPHYCHDMFSFQVNIDFELGNICDLKKNINLYLDLIQNKEVRTA